MTLVNVVSGEGPESESFKWLNNVISQPLFCD